MLHSLTLVAALLPAAVTVAEAQTLPSASRTVFKCRQPSGRVGYSDAPCIGAERVDVTPTRGLDKSSGRTQVGADVRKEVSREQFAQAVRPVTGMNPAQFDVAVRRNALDAAARRECRDLDVRIPRLEANERRVSGDARRAVQTTLFTARGTYRSLGC